MAHLETTLIEELINIDVSEWHRYVHDTFVLVDSRTKPNVILSILKKFHLSNKFNYQHAINNSFLLLGVRVT
jgi:hypothetical protein